MLIEKIMKNAKQKTRVSHRGFDLLSDHVAGYFSQNQLANSVDGYEAVHRISVGNYKL